LIDQDVIAALRPDGVIVEMATMMPAEINTLAEAATKKGKLLIDAPVSGGEEGAKNGSLSIMAGGDSHTIETVKPLLKPLGRLTHVGPTGSGSVAKLCNQIIVGNTVLAVAEALNMAEMMGADPKAVHTALQGGFADSVVLHEHGLRMVEENFTPGGPAKYMQQTLANICGIVAEKNIPLPLTKTSSKLYAAMIHNGSGEQDLSAVITELQNKK
jgi:2-hydroxy-3-oxopropionate reductase